MRAAALHLRAILAEKGRVMIEAERRAEIAARERFRGCGRCHQCPQSCRPMSSKAANSAFASELSARLAGLLMSQSV